MKHKDLIKNVIVIIESDLIKCCNGFNNSEYVKSFLKDYFNGVHINKLMNKAKQGGLNVKK